MNYRMKRLHSARETVVRTSELASSKSEGGDTGKSHILGLCWRMYSYQDSNE